MRCSPVLIVLLVGAACGEHLQAWKTDTEYQYTIQGRTLSALHDVADQYTGIVLRGLLTVQPQSDGTLQAKVTNARYAQIHTTLPKGWSSEIPHKMLDLKQLPMSEKVFEVKVKHGVVRDLIVDKSVPTWEVNVLKSIVSQLQVDTQGENVIPSHLNEEPEGDRVNAMFKTMEDSVGGKCEVLYDIAPLPEFVVQSRPELIPMPDLRQDGEDIIDIVKTKNFSNCEQRSGFHFGITGSNKWEPGTSDSGELLSRSSISRIIVTGDLKSFTIQSSVTTNKVILSPSFGEEEKGIVGSRVNLTLVKVGPVTSKSWVTPTEPESTGNLVYNYNDPFALGQNRRAGQPSENLNSEEEHSNRYNRYKKMKQQQEGLEEDTDSSKSADSLESDYMWYMQPKPNMNDAPAIPLLPYFVGHNGKSIHNAGDVDPVATAKSLASKVGSDLQNPSTIPEEQTLEKFTILANIIRTMSTQQIAEVQRELYQSANEVDPHDQSQSVKRSTWIAFRDAVAQAGTAPALVTIKNWIKEGKIQGLEGAMVVGVLSKTARIPTQEYIDTFFELVTMPETVNQLILNATALVTFGELVRYAQIEHTSSHSRYPVHIFGQLAPKLELMIVRDYVPYLADQLETAIKNNENAKSHAFIAALGNMAHPKVLSVFEPYLEGKIEVSTIQRLLMIFSLNKLATLRPRLVRGVFYRIYQNTGEAHQLRCAAVSSLMLTDPPVSMLQRMAEFTNDDHSKYVNAAVKSAIESASELESSEWADLAKKAQSVEPLLNQETYGFEYSRNYLVDYIEKELNLAYHVQSGYITGEDSFVPQVYYAVLQVVVGGFKLPKTNADLMISSVKDLVNLWEEYMNIRTSSEEQSETQFAAEKIAKLLKIEAQPEEWVEGSFKLQSPFENKFLSFDRFTLQHLPELMKDAVNALENGHDFNIAMFKGSDVTVSFPMESGFPFVYTVKTPLIVKAAGSIQGQMKEKTVEGSIALRALYSAQVQARFGFVTPFEHQHYLAGVDKNFQLYVPISVKVEYNTIENRAVIKIQPIELNERNVVLHKSVVPFTSCHDILNLIPIAKDEKTHKLRGEELWKQSRSTGSRAHGMLFQVHHEKSAEDMVVGVDDSEDFDLWSALMPPTKPEYSMTEVAMEPINSKDQGLALILSHEMLQDTTTKYDEKRSKSVKAKVPQIKSKKQNDPSRKTELLKEAAEGIAAADAYALEIGIETLGVESIQSFVTVAFASSSVDEKSRGLFFWKIADPRMVGTLEACAGVEFKSARPFTFDKSAPHTEENELHARKFDVVARVGESCETGFKIEIEGTQEQTKDYRDEIMKLPETQECVKIAKKGVKFSAECRDVMVKLSTLDKTEVDIKHDDISDYVRRDFNNFLDEKTGLWKDVVAIRNTHINGSAGTRMTPDKNTIWIKLFFSPEDRRALFAYNSYDSYIFANNIDAGPFVDLLANVDNEGSLADHLNMELSDSSLQEHTCVLNPKSATTFDKRTYPIDLGNCWHVAMTTYPKSFKDTGSSQKISDDMKLSILVKDVSDDNKEVVVTLGNKELRFSHVASENQVTLDGKKLDLAEKRSYRHKHEDEVDFEVLQNYDQSLWLLSSEHDVELWFDGQHIKIKASGKYRDDVRGLCGNFDGEPANDFITPKNCVLSKPEEFAASFALLSNECQGHAIQLAKKAKEATCSQINSRPGNVVSDRDAGRRTNPEKSKWGHHSKLNDHEEDPLSPSHKKKQCTIHRTKVVEENDQVCFSLRPLPTCDTKCKAARIKPKVMPMHCIPNNAYAARMKESIKLGANPDFSHKQVSKKAAFDLPVLCRSV